MLSFSDFMKVYEAYTMYAKTSQVTQPAAQTVAQSATQTVTQPVTQTVTQPVTQTVTQPVTQTVTQPSNADILAALGALQTPIVSVPTPKPETIDDVICRIAGIPIPDDTKKGDNK